MINSEDQKEQILKLTQLLEEIKEIVKPYQRNIDKICEHCRRYDGRHACCIDDINCYQYKKPTTPACDKYCELKEFEINNIANQILQKISECKVENDNRRRGVIMNDLITIILFIISVSSGIFGLITNNADFILVAVILFLFDMVRRK